MRITLLNQYYLPDEAPTGQFLGDLGGALVRAGHEVRAIACDRSYADPKRTYPSTEVIDGVQVVRVRSTGFGRGNKLGRVIDYATYYLGTTFRLLFGKRPDVVIALTTPPMIALLASVLGRIRGFPTIFWSMDVYPDIAYELGAIRRGSMAGRVFGFLSHQTLKHADCSVALGETMAERLTALGARRVEVIHNWAAEGSPESGIRSAESMRATFGWGARFVVMYSGNMGLAHEFDTLIEAARRMEQDDPLQRADEAPLFAFVGGGPRRAEVQRKVSELGLKNVEFRGYVDRERVGDSLAAPDVHLVTMREGMAGLLVPSKIYGILAAGKPTIYVGPYQGEIYDILASGECGIAVKNGDVQGLLDAIGRYRHDQELRVRHGRSALALYQRAFQRAASLERFVALVQNIA